jgi:hypothetical protein
MITNTVSTLVLCMDHGTVPISGVHPPPIMGGGEHIQGYGMVANEEGFPQING